MKRIMFLGAGKYQIEPIIYAKDRGYYVITCDNRPDNPGHKYSDEYYNVSTIEKEKVLDLAKQLDIDGIVSYASDVSAPTQAYVANKLGLPSNPYDSVKILTRKDLFRKFLKSNDFYVVKSEVFSSFQEALVKIEQFKFPIMVKPVDSSGSKGVNKIENMVAFESVFEEAMRFSIAKKVIVEEFFERDSYQIGGDCFVQDGKITFTAFTNTHFNPRYHEYVPSGGSLPSIHNRKTLEHVKNELQRLFELLKIHMGAFNIEFLKAKDGSLLMLEVGPRNGGNLLPVLIKHATGIDLIRYTVEQALGNNLGNLKEVDSHGFYGYYLVHSDQEGIFEEMKYLKNIKHNIIEKKIFVKKGDILKRKDLTSRDLALYILKKLPGVKTILILPDITHPKFKTIFCSSCGSADKRINTNPILPSVAEGFFTSAPKLRLVAKVRSFSDSNPSIPALKIPV